MELALATMEDIAQELRRRKTPFVLFGVEPSNEKKTNVQIAAGGTHLRQILRLLRLGKNVIEESPNDYAG